MENCGTAMKSVMKSVLVALVLVAQCGSAGEMEAQSLKEVLLLCFYCVVMSDIAPPPPPPPQPRSWPPAALGSPGRSSWSPSPGSWCSSLTRPA